MKPKLIRITTIAVSFDKLLNSQMRYMSDHFDVVAVSSPSETFDRVVKEQGVRGVAVEMSRQITPLKDLKSLVQLTVLLLRQKPTIVHTHTPKAGTLGMLAAWICRVPVRMHTVAGLPLLEATGKKRMLLDVVERITYGCATKVYPNSFGLWDIIVQNGYCAAQKIHVIGNGSSNGIDTAYFAPQTAPQHRSTTTSQSFTFIFVGRIVGDKGINELVRAFVELVVGYPSVKLLLVGRFEKELDPVKREVEEQILNHSNIEFVGFQADVRPFFAMADALVFPSYREGFPNVVMQAGAMGLPSIVTNINGCNEIIVEGENGVIIPPKNQQALFDAMKMFVEEPDRVQQLASNAREMIASRYEQRVVWEAMLEEYKKMIKG